VRTSTRITHTDPRAEAGAVLIALAVRETIRRNGQVDPIEFLALCRQEPLTDEWPQALGQVEQSLISQESADEFAKRIKCERGVSGYIIHTVSAVLFCWLRWPGEFRRPLEEVIMLGGDADTTSALLGGLAGASCGAAAIPTEWINRLIEWPYSVSWMRTVLSPQLQHSFGPEMPRPVQPSRVVLPHPQPLNALFVLTRNLVFLGIVLTHGIRRLLPPY
jgi:ADP-ribosylglycohydrolase